MKERLFSAIIVLLLLLYVIFMLIIVSNKYEDEITSLKDANKKLNKQVTEKNLVIESLLDGVECDCGFYEDFYYDHANELGAFE